MKKYKSSIRTILEVLLYILVYFSLSSVNNPFLTVIAIVAYLAIWTNRIVEKIRYRRGQADHVLIPSQNDQFSKISSLVIGAIAITGSIVWLVYSSAQLYIPFIGFIIGLLLITNGILDLPKGMIRVSGDDLLIMGAQKKIALRQLRSITINANTIVIEKTNGERTMLPNFNINNHSAELISNYISAKAIGSDLVVINKLGLADSLFSIS